MFLKGSWYVNLVEMIFLLFLLHLFLSVYIAQIYLLFFLSKDFNQKYNFCTKHFVLLYSIDVFSDIS